MRAVEAFKKNLKKLGKNEQGGMVVEAAVTLPFFLAFVLALIVLVQVAAAEMALQSTVSEVTKQISHYYMPFEMLQKKLEGDMDSLAQKAPMPEQLRPIMEIIKTRSADQLLPPLLTPILRTFADQHILNPERLSVTYVRFPQPNEEQTLLELRAAYVINIRLPFISREIVLQRQALEKVWTAEGVLHW